MRLPRHQDIDSHIAEAPHVGIFWGFVLAAGFVVMTTTMVLMVAAYLAGWIRLGWSFCFVPLLALAAVTLIPASFKLSWIWWDILDMFQETLRAWTDRARYSQRVNTGKVSVYELPTSSPEERRPVVFNSPKGTKLLANTAAAIPAADDVAEAEPESQERQPERRELIILPNGTRVPPDTIEKILIQLLEQGRGLGRKAWVPKILDREVYDGLWALFSSCGIIVGRKNRYAGKLGIETMDEARAILQDILGE